MKDGQKEIISLVQMSDKSYNEIIKEIDKLVLNGFTVKDAIKELYDYYTAVRD